LDMTNCVSLWSLQCQSNQLSADALDALFETLHSNTINDVKKTIILRNNPGANSCDSNIAKNKGWRVEL